MIMFIIIIIINFNITRYRSSMDQPFFLLHFFIYSYLQHLHDIGKHGIV